MAAYDPFLGLKTSFTNTWAGGNTWTETYGYDPNFDYLTSVNYGDGNPNPIQNWTYDAAGNRTDSVCDNLNRPVTIGGVACTSDILGNRLTTGSTSMSWDCLNRMTGLSNASGTWNYLYRADGMRVSKTSGANATIYRYDGQMSMEDIDTGSNPAVTDYAIGARGIDAISKTVGSNTVVVYPIYDAHGNMVADISRAGSGTFAVNDKRSFDAWGGVRSGATSGDPKGRYCANLGHVQDDESGLVYMRARYYEPASGRFISEDPDMQGANWFQYCAQCPMNRVDQSGRSWADLASFIRDYEAGKWVDFSIAMVWCLIRPLRQPAGEVAFYIGARLQYLAEDLISGGSDQFAAGLSLFKSSCFDDFGGPGMGYGANQMFLGAASLAAGIALLYIADFIMWSGDFLNGP